MQETQETFQQAHSVSRRMHCVLPGMCRVQPATSNAVVHAALKRTDHKGSITYMVSE